jgi:hypothetical protein
MTHSRSTSWTERSRTETRTCNFREGRIFAYFQNLFFFFAPNWSDRINTRNLGLGQSNPHPFSPAHARRHASQSKGLTISVKSCTSLQVHFDVPISETKSFNCEWFEFLTVAITDITEMWYCKYILDWRNLLLPCSGFENSGFNFLPGLTVARFPEVLRDFSLLAFRTALKPTKPPLLFKKKSVV